MDLSQVTWRKSSRSGNGANCIEAAVVGHKADAGRLVLIRDSKNPNGAILAISPAEWHAFIAEVKGGKFDHMS